MSDIVLSTVTKVFPNGVRAVDGVDLVINDGEFVVLVGPSGCGKSTLLRMVAGLEDITEGAVHIGGTDVTDMAPQQRDIAMVFQNYALYPHMTVKENLAYGLKLREDAAGGVEAARRRRSPRRSASRSSSTASRPRSRAASGSAWRWAAQSSASRRRS